MVDRAFYCKMCRNSSRLWSVFKSYDKILRVLVEYAGALVERCMVVALDLIALHKKCRIDDVEVVEAKDLER